MARAPSPAGCVLVWHPPKRETSQDPPHNWPRLRPPRHFSESGLLESRHEPRPRKRIDHRSLLRILRIPLNDHRALFARVINRCPKQLRRQPTPPILPRYIETRHRPHRLFIYWLQNSGSFQNWIISSRRHCAPRHRLTSSIGQYTCRSAGFHDAMKSSLVPSTLLLLIFRAPQSPPHAPASARSPPRTEQGIEVRPCRLRQRTKRNIAHSSFDLCCNVHSVGGILRRCDQRQPTSG